MNLQVNKHIDGYVLLGQLGQGGMSEVFHAYDDKNKREVVLKIPHEDVLTDPAAYERFLREVKIGELLTHPHIQKLYVLAGTRSKPYLVLEYVEGATWRELLEQMPTGILPVEQVLNWAGQIAEAIGYAHSQQVYHRDLKPENIIITAQQQVKVMDFGIALLQGSRRVTWGKFSPKLGTPTYMAPEQINGKRGDARTDIYALGIMLYEALAGCPPFKGEDFLETMRLHLAANPPSLLQANPTLTPALTEVILKALRRNPALRWASMSDFATALQNPTALNLADLQAERKLEEAKKTAPLHQSALEKELGISLGQIALIILAILLVFVAILVAIQLFHH
jgi:serine/threonine-protein kinase